MKTKTFDCVEMKHEGAAAIQKRLAGMTKEQQQEYWEKQNKELRKLKDKLTEKSTSSSKV